MMTDPKITFTYDPELHKTICQRAVHNKIYIGVAQCHPHDYDFENKLTGQHYAYTRSMIKEMCQLRDEYKIQLKALKHLYNIYEQSPVIDVNSSEECYYLRRQMQILQRDINEMKRLISETRGDLRSTIAEKDKLYAKLRASRNSSNS
jgi:hypothetical protein